MEIKPLTTWSFSRLQVFEQCKFRAQLQYGQKIPEPERPLPPGKTEHANDRGSRIHDTAEQYVRGNVDRMDPAMRAFAPEFDSLRQLFADDMVSLEGEWATDTEWQPTAWTGRNTWQRLKLDAMVRLNKQEAVVIDYKTGKKFGNEVKHGEQTMLYALNTFLRFPELELITTELWYLDQDDLTSATFERERCLRFKHSWNRRALAMTEAVDFPANPNQFSCRYCAYSKREGGTGDCERGVVNFSGGKR
jgi:hypothetical protein